MNALSRYFLWAFTAQTLLFGACATLPELTDRLNLNVWKLPEMERQIEQNQSEIDRDNVTLSEVQERIVCRERIADEVVEGRLGLLAAAARFYDLNAGVPAGTPALRDGYVGDSDEERCCRQVIGWVTTRLSQNSTAEAQQMANQLEEELRVYLRRSEGMRDEG